MWITIFALTFATAISTTAPYLAHMLQRAFPAGLIAPCSQNR
jgi:hypothetical protein